MAARGTLEGIWRQAVAACDPRQAVRAALVAEPLPQRAVTVIAIGKAAGAMAAGAAAALGERMRAGIVVTVDGVVVEDVGLPVRRAGHPVPDLRSEAAGREVMAVAAGVQPDDLLLALVSGGASALVAVPRDGLTLADKIERTGLVARQGAPIAVLNRARSELSAIKDGRLAALCPAPVRTLVVSDVPGDDVAVVGSGPTVPGKAGDVVRLVAGLATLRAEAAHAARAVGYRIEEQPAPLEGTVEDVARVVVAVAARLAAGSAWVAGGEWTVAVPVTAGVGGRAVHLALLVARALDGVAGVQVLVAGSDGIDGSGPAAGATIDGATWAALQAAGIDGAHAIASCDAGAALAAVGATIVSGPTGVNHADLVIVVRPRDR